MTQDTTIQHQVVSILLHKFNFPETVLVPGNWDKPLTGRLFNIPSTDLVCLLFELEAAFAVRIPEQYLDNYGFCSIDKITEAISECTGQP